MIKPTVSQQVSSKQVRPVAHIVAFKEPEEPVFPAGSSASGAVVIKHYGNRRTQNADGMSIPRILISVRCEIEVNIVIMHGVTAQNNAS